MAVTITPLGFKKPDGNELVRGGDNAIADNAQKAEDLVQADRGRLGAIEAVNTAHGNRLTAAESGVTSATSRVAAVESANATQGTRLTSAESSLTSTAAALNTTNSRVSATESVNAAQNVRLSSVESAAFVGGGLLTEDPADPGFYLVGAP